MPLAFPDYDEGPDKWGGVIEKRDDDIAGVTPHAWGIYRALQSAQGKAFSKDRYGYLHAENLAEARFGAGCINAAEKLYHNAFPSRADELLSYWVDVLAIRVYPDDTDDDVRAKCAARFLTWAGNSPVHINAAIRALLRDVYHSVVRFSGNSLDNPQPRTYWPPNPGPTTFDLGANGGDTGDRHPDGAWYSDHSRILVLARDTTPLPRRKLYRLLNVDLNDLLSRRIPAFTSWDWAFSSTFTLDVSGLGTAAVDGA